MNFGNHPVRVHGVFIENLNTTSQVRAAGASADVREYSRRTAQQILQLGDTVTIYIHDHDLKAGRYVLRIMFSTPTFPNQTLTFDVPFVKHSDGPDAFYALNNATYNLEEKDGISPAERPTRAKIKKK